MSSNHITRASFPQLTLDSQLVLHGISECECQKKTSGNILSSPLLFIEAETEAQWGRVTHARLHSDLEPLTHTQSTCESLWVWHYLPCMGIVQSQSKELSMKVFLLRHRKYFSFCCKNSSLTRMSWAEETEGVYAGTQKVLFTTKLFHWASSSASEAPSELSHLISAKVPGETKETLELKRNL